MALWARAKSIVDARPRVVVQATNGPVGGWLDRLAARPDVAVERIESGAPLVRAARDARLVVLVAPFPLPPGEDVSLLVRLRELRGELTELPAVVLLQSAESAKDEEIALGRETLFAAGATDVVFLPADGDRLEDAIGQFAGIGARRFVRHRIRATAKVREGARESEAQVENLSAGGVQIRLATTPANGAVLRLSLPLDRRESLDCWATVRSAAPAASSTVVRLRFVGMRRSERERLESFLASLDADTRSTEPADAIAGVRRFDANSLRAALAEPSSVPDWLAASMPALSASEKRALGPASPAGTAAMWVAVAVARTQGGALCDALEKYDPSLDGETSQVRETVLGVLNRLRAARVDLAAWSSEPEAGAVITTIDETSNRLVRAMSARLPDLAAAWERSGGHAAAVADLGLSDLTVRQFENPRLRKRLIAAGAGLMLGGAVVYAVVAHFTRNPVP